MILNKDLTVRWHRKTKYHYEKIVDGNGEQKYLFDRFGGVFLVDIEDVFPGSTNKIDVMCDYCGNIEEKIYRNWRIHYDISPVKKDACIKCRGKKTKESNLINYGVTNVMHIDEVKEKVESTNLEIYGVKYAGGSKHVQDKVRNTTLEKYGVEHYFQTDEFKEKYIETMQEKYGVDNSFQAEEVKEKSKLTLLENWGVEYNMQSPEIRAKAVQTMYERSSTPTSKPQIYLHQVYGGELNYPFERYNLDIALVDEKIVIEYDGGAHDLKVTLGGISEEDFNRREIIRGAYLKQAGWKLITIKSKKDNLPEDGVLLEMVENAREVFQTGRSWVNYCIDSETIVYRNVRNHYDFKSIVKYRDVLKKVK